MEHIDEDLVRSADLFGDVSRLADTEARRLHAASITLDLFFFAFLRQLGRFGYFNFGPVSIDVRLIQDIVERTTPRAESDSHTSPPIDENAEVFFNALSDELRRSGSKRLDELHLLLAFMRIEEGLPGRVFGELGVTPAQVEEFGRSGGRSALPEKLYSPEEAAQYLNVHVQTVRAWIRSGRLRARRLAGQRALRIADTDLLSVLEPLNAEDME